jgi:hypothetical protein
MSVSPTKREEMTMTYNCFIGPGEACGRENIIKSNDEKWCDRLKERIKT